MPFLFAQHVGDFLVIKKFVHHQSDWKNITIKRIK